MTTKRRIRSPTRTLQSLYCAAPAGVRRARQVLALWAEVRRPAAEDDALDRRAAPPAGFAGPVVDAVQRLERAAGAVGVSVVAQGAAAFADGPAQSGLDRA